RSLPNHGPRGCTRVPCQGRCTGLGLCKRAALAQGPGARLLLTPKETEPTMTTKNPPTLMLKPLGRREVPGEARSSLKVEGGIGNAKRIEWLPLAHLNQSHRVAEFIADRFGYICEDKDELLGRVAKLKRDARKVPRIVGTSRLG